MILNKIYIFKPQLAIATKKLHQLVQFFLCVLVQYFNFFNYRLFSIINQ
jgi:hypothetical protein